MTPVKTTGIIVGRFQTPVLTEGHKHLLSQVASRSARVVVLIGCSPAPWTKRDPMEFLLRARMVQDYWLETYGSTPELTVLPCINCQTDAEWARRIDQMVDAVTTGSPATLYCGYDGCGPTYTKAGGRWPVDVIDAIGGHATASRAAIQPRYSEDFRAGIIYATQRQYTATYQTIDIALLHGDEILLAKKQEDGFYWRLVGGFVDTRDASLEQAAQRELMEETGLSCTNVRYVGSAIIDDWRYRGSEERILTAIFVAEYQYGAPVAADDIHEVRWFPIAEASSLIHPCHADILTKVQLQCIKEGVR